MMAGMKRTDGDRNGPYCAGDWITSRGGGGMRTKAARHGYENPKV